MCADRIEEVLIIFKFEDEVIVAKGPRRMVVIGAEDEIHCAVVLYASHLARMSKGIGAAISRIPCKICAKQSGGTCAHWSYSASASICSLSFSMSFVCDYLCDTFVSETGKIKLISPVLAIGNL